jgi:hypothetical protein
LSIEALPYHDNVVPYLCKIYDDGPVQLFGEEWHVSVRGALLRPKELREPKALEA